MSTQARQCQLKCANVNSSALWAVIRTRCIHVWVSRTSGRRIVDIPAVVPIVATAAAIPLALHHMPVLIPLILHHMPVLGLQVEHLVHVGPPIARPGLGGGHLVPHSSS